MNKKSIMALGLSVIALGMSAAAPQRIDVGGAAHHPVLSPDASVLLFSSIDHTGLNALDIASGAVTVLDESASAGFQPVFTIDGSQVYYRTGMMIDGLMYRDVRAYNFNEGAGRRVAAPSRDHSNLAALAGGAYAMADFGSIEVYAGGKLTKIAPVADAHHYQWAAMSPDATTVAFAEPFSGVYTCALDGSALTKVLDKGDYVSWAGPETVIAVVSHDDGYVIIDSRLVAVNVATGAVEYLTGEDMKVGEATASATGMVVFTDLDGNLFTINLNK